MTHFESFDNLEDMLETIQERAAEAMKNLHPLQKTIKAGDYVLVPKPELGVLIFGKTFSDAESLQSEKDAGASEEEAQYTVKHLTESRQRGYYFGRWYSPIVPEGEYGDQHVSVCWPINKSWFELAQKFKWRLPTDALIAMFDEILPDEERG